jgi:hypothetical protein
MSKGDLLTNGQGGKNTPFQFNLLQIMGLVASSTSGGATEATLQLVLTAIQDGQDYEAKLVRDSDTPSVTWLEVRIYNPGAGTWDPPVYYPAGSTTPGSPVLPVVYIDPTTLLATIASNTTGIALEATLVAFAAKFNSLGQKASAASAPMVLSTEQEAILTAMAVDLAAIEVLLTGASKVPSLVVAVADGSTTAGVKGMSMWVRGTGATIDGVAVPNGARFSWGASDNDDTVGAISFTVPTGGALQIIITYLT